jgi:uncharacterized protein (TIRG00374 family)
LTTTKDHRAVPASRQRGRPAFRHYARPGLLLAVTGVSLYLLLPSLVAVFSSWRSLTQLTWYWATLALVSEAGSLVFLWQLDRIALHERSWFTVASAQLAGKAAGRILPGGGATGTAVSVSMLHRTGIDTGQATAALSASGLLQLGTTFALALLALPAVVGGAPVSHSLIVSAYLGALVLILLIVVGFVTFAFDRPLAATGRAAQWLLNRTIRRKRPVVDLAGRLLAERDFVNATIGPRWRAAVISASGCTGLDYLALLCALEAVGAEPRASLVLLAYVGANLLELVPITPGGLGFVEAGLVGTLTLAGVAPQDALLATLAYRLVSYWLPIPAGGLAFAAFRRRYA